MKPLVVGIDPGSSHWSIYGFSSEETILDISISTAHWFDIESALQDVVELAPDLVVGPSGYGLPLVKLNDLSALDKELAVLYKGNSLIGVRKAWEALQPIANRVVLIPGVKHLSTVPSYRKINRIDMGTADKVCATVNSISIIHEMTHIPLSSISFVHAELGHGFNAYIGVENGRIVDGIGGTMTTLSFTSGGTLDAELAYLLNKIPKKIVFQGGILSSPNVGNLQSPHELLKSSPQLWNAYIEAIAKDIARILVSIPSANMVILSGQYGNNKALNNVLKSSFSSLEFRTITKTGYASVAARGAALMANGLSGGKYKSLIEHLKIREAQGNILDHIFYEKPDLNCLLSHLHDLINKDLPRKEEN